MEEGHAATELANALADDIYRRGESALVDRALLQRARRLAELCGADADAAPRRALTLLYLSRRPEALMGPVGLSEAGSPRAGFDELGEELLASARAFARAPSSDRFGAANDWLTRWLDNSRPQTRAYLTAELARRRVEGLAPTPLLRVEARALGITDAETEAVAQRAREVADQAAHGVEETVRRAFWDSVRARAEAAEYEVLFDLSRELKSMLLAVLFCAPRYRERVDECFDVDLLQQEWDMGQGDFPHTLRRVILYVTGVLTEIVAAADAAKTLEWQQNIRAELDDEQQTPTQYIQTSFVEWLSSCFHLIENINLQIHALSRQE